MHNTTLRIATATALASALVLGSVTGSAHAETTTTVTTNTTSKSGVTQEEANALEVAGVVVGLLAVLAALMAGWMYFAAPHLGLALGPLR